MEDSKFASRKFLLAAIALVSSAVLLSVGILAPEQWVTFVPIILGLYFTANVAQKAVVKP